MAAPWGDPEIPAISGRFLEYTAFVAVKKPCTAKKFGYVDPSRLHLANSI
jgi:hypothetical protein